MMSRETDFGTKHSGCGIGLRRFAFQIPDFLAGRLKQIAATVYERPPAVNHGYCAQFTPLMIKLQQRKGKTQYAP